jgi:hypothetical protein
MPNQTPVSGTARGLRTRGTVAVAIATLACAGTVAACGSSGSSKKKTKLDTARVARSIEQSILSQRHLRAAVVCPPSVPQEQGRTFECTATLKVKHRVVKTPFVVTIQNKKGFVTYVGK